MKKLALSIAILFSSILLVSCGGGSGGDTSTGGASGGGTGGDSGGGTDNNNGAGTDDNSGGGTDGGSTDSPSTKTLLDRTKTYPVLSQTLVEHLRITEKHQNSGQLINFNLWDYSYSPTNIEKTITFESYESNNSTSDVVYRQLIAEDIYEYSPRPIVQSENSRKVTQIRYEGGDPYLSSINYDTKTGLQFNNETPPELINIKVKTEPELISAGLQEANRDFCSEDTSTGEIYYSITANGFWQIGDEFITQHDVSSPVVSCDENNSASIVGSADANTTSVDTLTKYHSVFSLRGRDFHNVIEFNNLQTTRSSGQIAFQAKTKIYLQYFTGRIAEIETACFGAIDAENVRCNTTEEVATNVPSIPEI